MLIFTLYVLIGCCLVSASPFTQLPTNRLPAKALSIVPFRTQYPFYSNTNNVLSCQLQALYSTLQAVKQTNFKPKGPEHHYANKYNDY